MENQINLEQPQAYTNNSQEILEMGQSNSEGEGSKTNLNKFKSVDALNDAYNSLQAEFTKKCQRLSELEKEKSEKDVFQYSLDSWPQQLANFFENNHGAKEHSNEIAKIILEDKELAKKSDCLTLAWAKILSTKKINENDLVNNNEFLNKYIYSNEKIKDEIIKNYLNEKAKPAPNVISSNRGASFNITPKNKPSTIEQAKNLVKELFK